MKAKISKFLFISFLALGALSFLYLNIIGMPTDAQMGEVFVTEKVFQQADVKVAKFLLDQLQNFILNL